MSVPVLTFFNNKGGVGKTSLVFHLAWMMAEELRLPVVAIDLDPQANLTSAFLDERRLEALWDLDNLDAPGRSTVYQCIRPLTEVGDLAQPLTQAITPRLHLLPGDLGLASFEDLLSQEWSNAFASPSPFRAFRVLTAFWQLGQMAAREHGAQLVLADVGPTLGAINRAAMIGSDHVVIPLAADLFSLQGLRNLGPTLRRWRADWVKQRANWATPSFELPSGGMQPAGYVVMQHMDRLSRPVKAYQRWMDRIPATYRESVLGEAGTAPDAANDPHLLARLKHYRSLVPMAQEARKPIFKLTAADGAIGNHAQAVSDARADFRQLALAVLDRIGVGAPQQA